MSVLELGPELRPAIDLDALDAEGDLGEKGLEPRSRRPHRQRQPTWTSALVRKIEQLRADHPMWGKRKLAVLLRREGVAVSVSTVGRILTKLMARGVVTPARRGPPG